MNRKVKTAFPVAKKSLDHLHPLGAKQDLSRQMRFEAKLAFYMDFKSFNKIMDLGCSGGAFISNMHDIGYLAVGLEGSDFSKKNKRGPWAYLSDFVLFTSDITKHFEVLISNKRSPELFDIITAFEVLEHLKEEQIDSLFKNIEIHSHKNSRLIFSISESDDFFNGVNLHQTVKSRKWWILKLKRLGWIECRPSMKYFNKQYLRGRKFNAPNSFELVLRRIDSRDNEAPKLNIIGMFLDWNSGSKFQKLLYKLVHGDKVYNHF